MSALREPSSSLSGALLWLSIFISTAVFSASLGFVFGQRALSGVSSPVGRATTSRPGGTSAVEFRDPRTIPLVNEQEVIVAAKKALTPNPTPTPTPTPLILATPTPEPIAPSPTPTPTATPLALSPELATPTAPPIAPPPPVVAANPQTASGQVSLQVLSARQEAGQLVLNVAMQNNSSQGVRFLYSFMKVTDERGRSVAASTQGLPGELPANGQVFQGTVRIPLASLTGSRSVSLNLADYPSRQHQLSVSGIPVPQ
ncbi:MAG: hypothetical protein NW237_00925 [Cyanobacteriota bacterium]|nr:hypothetical protein [Cyanobacteriota bacterium]